MPRVIAAGTDYLELHAHALVSLAEVFGSRVDTEEAASSLREAIELLRRKGNVVERGSGTGPARGARVLIASRTEIGLDVQVSDC